MGTLEFISKFIWPAVVIITILVFRKPLIQLICSISRLKYKDFEAEFDKDLRKAEKIIDVNPDDSNIKIDNPKLDVIQSWNELEKAAKQKLESLKIEKHYDNFQHTFIEPLNYLINKGCFSYKTTKMISDLRGIRNRIVHQNAYDISENLAKRYISIINAVKLEIISIEKVPAAKLYMLTSIILVVNHLIDTGKYNNLSIDTIFQKIDDETILDFIGEMDDTQMLNIILNDKRTKDYFINELQSLANVIDLRRKFGINNNGLCAFLAMINEMIQHAYPDAVLYNSRD